MCYFPSDSGILNSQSHLNYLNNCWPWYWSTLHIDFVIGRPCDSSCKGSWQVVGQSQTEDHRARARGTAVAPTAGAKNVHMLTFNNKPDVMYMVLRYVQHGSGYWECVRMQQKKLCNPDWPGNTQVNSQFLLFSPPWSSKRWSSSLFYYFAEMSTMLLRRIGTCRRSLTRPDSTSRASQQALRYSQKPRCPSPLSCIPETTIPPLNSRCNLAEYSRSLTCKLTRLSLLADSCTLWSIIVRICYAGGSFNPQAEH